MFVQEEEENLLPLKECGRLRFKQKRIKLLTYMLMPAYFVQQKQQICSSQLFKALCGVSYGIIRTSFNLCRNCFQIILRLDTVSHFNFLLALMLIQNVLEISFGQMKHEAQLLFVWFHEYSQLPNLGTRTFVFNLTGFVTGSKSNGVLGIYNILYSWPIFFVEFSARVLVRCSITRQTYASLLKSKIVSDLQTRQCLLRTIFMEDKVSPHINCCVIDVLKRQTLHRRKCRQFSFT